MHFQKIILNAKQLILKETHQPSCISTIPKFITLKKTIDLYINENTKKQIQ